MSEVMKRPANEVTQLPEQPGALSVLAIVARAAADPACDIEKMKALREMYAEERAHQARIEFAADFSLLAGHIPNISKRGEQRNKGELMFKYTRWDDVMKALTPLLEEYGFSLTFESAPRPGEGGGLTITGCLLHRAGHQKQASIGLPLDTGPGRSNLQAIGSTISYGQKYVAKMLLNLVFGGDDNDGVTTQGFLTKAQVEEIDALLIETGSNLSKWLPIIGVPSVEEIPYVRFEEAKGTLLRKREQMAARKTGAAP